MASQSTNWLSGAFEIIPKQAWSVEDTTKNSTGGQERIIIDKFPQPYKPETAGQNRTDFSKKAKDFVVSQLSKEIVFSAAVCGDASLIGRNRNEDFGFKRFAVLGQPVSLSLLKYCVPSRFYTIAIAHNVFTRELFLVEFDLSSGFLAGAREDLKNLMFYKGRHAASVFLVGMKKHLCEPATLEEVEKRAINLAKEIGAEYWSISLETGENVDLLFKRIVALEFEKVIEWSALGIPQKSEDTKQDTGSTMLGSVTKWLGSLAGRLTNHPQATDDTIIYNDAYHRALEAGEASNTRIPVMIVGQDRVGKTSLKKHLLGLSHDSQEPSTCGVEVSVIELTDENAEEPWTKKEVKGFIMAESEAKRHVFKQTAELVTQEKSKAECKNKQPEVSCRDTHMSHSGKQEQANLVPPLSKVEIKDIKSLGKRVSGNKSQAIRLLLHDFAGQCIFYDTHYYFLRLQCPYIVVHDLTVPFEDPAQPRFKPRIRSRFHRISSNPQRNLSNPHLITNLDYFLSWLTVLERLPDSTGETVSEKIGDCKYPPVVIVLTNSDRFEGNVDEATQKIKDILVEKGFENVFTEIYIVDNTSSGKGKDDIRKLRGMVYGLCKSILEKQSPIPVRWLQFEAALCNKMVVQKLSYISLEEAREAARTCNVQDVDAAIRFLHHRGVIVHHVNSPVVVLNPQWLMNVFTEVISVPQEVNPSDALYRKLMAKGILMQEYLERKGHGKVLEQLMIQFGLICPWEHEGKPAFIVPSVAPLMEDGEDVQEQLSASPIAPVFFRFKLGYVLPGLFTRFLVKMINKFREFLHKRQPQLYSNYTLLVLEHNEGKFDIYLVQQIAAIKIGVVPRSNISQRSCKRFVRHLKEAAVDCMKSIKDDEELFYRKVDVSLFVKCSVCHGETEPCLRHDKERCPHDDCGHFWSLEELETCTEDPVCDHASVVRRQEFSLTPVKAWLSNDEALDLPPGNEVTPPDVSNTDHLQTPEAVKIAQRIPGEWAKVALLTKQFGTHEIENIRCSRVDEDASSKALIMLQQYIERQGSRRTLANALRDINNNELADKVLSGYFNYAD